MSANKFPFKSGSLGYVIMCYGKMRTHRRPFSVEDFRKMKVNKPVFNEVTRSICRLVDHGFLSEKGNERYVITQSGERYLYALAQKNRIEMDIHISERNRESGMKGFAKKKSGTI